MTSLRSKLWSGFGGLLAILLVVSAVSFVVLTRYSHVLDRVFRENYDSAVFCDAMRESLDRLNIRAQRLIWDRSEAVAKADVNSDFESFETNLTRQMNNLSLPGEKEITTHLAELWAAYKSRYRDFDSVAANRQDAYRHDLLPRYQELKQVAQRIASMNMSNMVSVDGQVKTNLSRVRDVLLILAIAGSLLAVGFAGVVGAAILKSLRTLTQSARQIESGDLDLEVNVRSRDELGQLAHAFNSMAARLREFRRMDHDRLARTQATTQLAIDSLPDAVFVIGPGGIIEISNRSAQTHFGIVPGTSVDGLRLGWLTGIFQQVWTEHHAVEPAGYKSAIQLFENGEERFLLPRAVPMLDDKEVTIGVTVILVDVTRMRKADELKSGMLSTVSHELRTPLTSIRMGIHLLADQKLGPLTSRQQRSLDATREDSDRLHRIIENLLSLSRIEAGQDRFQLRPMSCSELVSQALDPLRTDFENKNIALDVRVPSDLPQVNVDPSCMGVALANLLTNALKYTPAGGRVGLEAAADGPDVCFSVKDSGPGIPDEFAPHIFDRFFRVPQKDGPAGAGLGLAIAREIVQSHGGTLTFANDGHGSTFNIKLPHASASPDLAPALPAPASAGVT